MRRATQIELLVGALSVTALVVGLVLIYQHTGPAAPPETPPLGPSVPIATLPTPRPMGTCRYNFTTGAILPDARCTPGETDPRVNQGNVNDTICRAGYTARVRPPVSYTNSLKRQQIAEYGQPNGDLATYEEDHLIPLEIGGAPSDPRNLWPEPGASPNDKDRVENQLHALVCRGQILLAVAQQCIATDWLACRRQYGQQ